MNINRTILTLGLASALLQMPVPMFAQGSLSEK